ncbi:LANO_0A02256g1_1 [Lachancea nothofagi CBS 11611]|uniref:LANO_0A02256g1_1 n=1 Tax=Lachancea nothofagi CBS 11611 TaxID=1266666 RepID=A0A1G4INW4_9SACH|nr:LANO_0A02256g1_1 [Lachancea nothofagi CBS 11611]
MSGNGIAPVDAHLVVRYAPADEEGSERSTRRASIQGTSICVAESWEPSSPESPCSRRASAALRVCDLYQCIHQHAGTGSQPQLRSASFVSRPGSQALQNESNPSGCREEDGHPRRFSDPESNTPSHGLTLGRSASFAAESNLPQPLGFGEMMWTVPRSRNSSLSSSSQGPSSTNHDFQDHSHQQEESIDQPCDNQDSSIHGPQQPDCWVDLSNPCCRHHHRRNSTAIKFRKALYEEQE